MPGFNIPDQSWKEYIFPPYYIPFLKRHAEYCGLDFCRTCFSMGDLGVQVSVRPSIRPSVRSSFHQHLPWVICEHSSSYRFLLFPHCELSHFLPSIYRQWVPLVSATPLTVLDWLFWNFVFSSWYEDVYVVWVLLLEHFCHFFHIVKLVIFTLNI